MYCMCIGSLLTYVTSEGKQRSLWSSGRNNIGSGLSRNAIRDTTNNLRNNECFQVGGEEGELSSPILPAPH